MERTREQRLERLRNHGTMWELIATNGNRKILAGYCNRKSRQMIFNVLAKHGEHWTALAGDETVIFNKPAAAGARMTNWEIKWSGRTQREAIITGELPFIKDVIEPLPGAFPMEKK